MQALAEAYAVDILCNKLGAQLVQPDQGIFAGRIYVEDVLNIENTLFPGGNLTGDANEFFNPLS
jgi:hypothetical protein